MATTAMVAPPVRHALYAATAPAHQRRLTAAYDATEPCAAPTLAIAAD
ncbi:hypothetical protein FHS31_000423 [Sphingomonas vulcanisoli]|uniref:Uncharacterized protein n=1 Tax=Sphingomonas vulcanisoli TaxID=1658060 RepID=A0ABX0TMU5_9SPHN|nr:hypothetical protein [Sphingomonas vulcanisoli]NIJ06841.1 hypothetical protein [Sphingomonas vulcanisoli]